MEFSVHCVGTLLVRIVSQQRYVCLNSFALSPTSSTVSQDTNHYGLPDISSPQLIYRACVCFILSAFVRVYRSSRRVERLHWQHCLLQGLRIRWPSSRYILSRHIFTCIHYFYYMYSTAIPFLAVGCVIVAFFFASLLTPRSRATRSIPERLRRFHRLGTCLAKKFSKD